MTKPLFKIQILFVQDPDRDKQKKHPTFVSHAAVQRRISIKLCMKIEDVRTIFALPLIFSIRP